MRDGFVRLHEQGHEGLRCNAKVGRGELALHALELIVDGQVALNSARQRFELQFVREKRLALGVQRGGLFHD